MNYTYPSTDPRIIRTLTFIREGFLNLLRQRPLEKITLEDIADAGMTSRNTVSKYYANRYELMDELCETALSEINSDCIAELPDDEVTWEIIVNDIVTNLQKDYDFYDLMISHDRYPKFLFLIEEKMINLINVLTVKRYGQELKEKKQAQINCLAAYFMESLRYWIKNKHCDADVFISNIAASLERIWNAEVMNIR